MSEVLFVLFCEILLSCALLHKGRDQIQWIHCMSQVSYLMLPLVKALQEHADTSCHAMSCATTTYREGPKRLVCVLQLIPGVPLCNLPLQQYRACQQEDQGLTERQLRMGVLLLKVTALAMCSSLSVR